MNACPEAPPPTISWRARLADDTAVTISVIHGRWHWRADHAEARQSIGHPNYPAALAAARHSLGLPAISVIRT